MLRYLLKNQNGSVIVLATFAFVVLMGMVGLALDMGNLYLQRIKIQNAVDAAALCGAQDLPNTASATTDANTYLTSNGEQPANATMSFANANTEMIVSVTRNVQTMFLSVLGFKSYPVGASATALLNGVGGPFNDAIFSGSTSISLPLNGSGFNIKGTVHTNNNLIVNGSSIIVTGAAQAVGTITTNGSGLSFGSLVPNSSFIAMPNLSATIAAAAATAGQVYVGNKTINGSAITANPMYVEGNVTVNGSGFTATGVVLSDGNVTINGSGIAAGNAQVCFYSENGNITINGSGIALNGVLYAPNGQIIINGSSITVDGSVVGNQVVINGSSFAVDRTDYPITSLTGTHTSLIQ